MEIFSLKQFCLSFKKNFISYSLIAIKTNLFQKKSDIVGISYSYSGSKAPKQTEITTSRFSEDEMLHLFSELKCVGKAAEQPIASSGKQWH